MALIYIDKKTAVIGVADDLVILEAESSEVEELLEESDSTIRAAAEEAITESTGLSIPDAVALLKEVAEQKGDWRGTLDYVIQSLSAS